MLAVILHLDQPLKATPVEVPDVTPLVLLGDLANVLPQVRQERAAEELSSNATVSSARGRWGARIVRTSLFAFCLQVSLLSTSFTLRR